MTTYTAITSGEVDSDSPITDTLMSRVSYNPIAIAEADATVPLDLLPTVLLASTSSASGSSITYSGLVLTPFKSLRIVLKDIDISVTNQRVELAGSTISVSNGGSSSLIKGMIEVDLANGVAVGMTAIPTSAGDVWTYNTGYSTATTSIVLATSSGNFSGGSIRLYGCK